VMGLADRAAQSLSRLRNRDEMNVIGHQAVRPDLNPLIAAPLAHQLDVRLVILIAEEGLLPTVSPLRDVVG
jgi:hypothetical protein